MSLLSSVAADIARELRVYPNNWTQGAFAVDTNGNYTNARNSRACAWCLGGHIIKRDPSNMGDYNFSSPLYLQFRGAVGRSVSSWNDVAERTVEDVIALCDRIASQG